MEANALKARIAGWLTATRGVEIPLGLEAHEARTRAQALLHEIQEGNVTPEQIPLDHDLKQVLSVVVSLLAESNQPPESRLKEADAIYQFIRRLPWPSDPFGEQQDLLRECAEIGLGALGLSVSRITRLRFSRDLREYASELPPSSFSSSAAVVASAEAYLTLDLQERQRHEMVGQTELLFAVIKLLSDRGDANPEAVLEEAEALFKELRDHEAPVGRFDEKQYFLGELAMVAGNTTRHLGKWADSERWLSCAESSFRLTVDPTPKVADVAYLRLAAKYDLRQYDEVLDAIPSLLDSFDKLRMRREYSKAEFLRGMCMKGLGKHECAVRIFEGLTRTIHADLEPQLLGQALVEVGAFHSSQNRHEIALANLDRALALLRKGNKPIFLAHLKATVAETLVLAGKVPAGISAYREAIFDYASLGVSTHAAYLRVLLADALLQLNCHREAELEILAALPTIEKQRMVPEGFAAVALLKESVRRRKTDPSALRELREHLQKHN